MKKLAALLMAAFLAFATATPANAEQSCQDVAGGALCITVENGQATVTAPGGVSLSVAVPTVEVPVPVPGATQTVTLPPPAPSTVTRTAAPTTVTRTATATETTTITETPAPVTATRTFTPPYLATPPVDTSVGQDRGQADTIVERVVRNVGVPLLWIVIGVILAILIQYLMYAMGRSDAKHADDKFLEGILNRKKN